MILIVSAVFPPEPVVSSMLSYDLATELSKQFDVLVLSPYPTRPFGNSYSKPSFEGENFRHIMCDSYTFPKSSVLGRIRESYSFGEKAATFIHKNHKAIKGIYANAWPLFCQAMVVGAAKKYKIPVVMHIQDIYPESFATKSRAPFSHLIKTFLTPLDKFSLKNSDKIITISAQMKEYLVTTRNLEREKVQVVRNWQDHHSFVNYTQPKKPENVITFMYLGSVSPSAGVDHLIRSFCLSGILNSKLVIAGRGSELAKCKALAEMENNPRIVFCDAPVELVPQIQAEADVLLLPIKKGIGATASPSKLPTYLFSQKPVIASVDAGSDAAEIILAAQCGWVVHPEDEHALAGCMKQVAQMHPEKLIAFGENGREYALKHFTKEVCLNRIVNIIKDAL